MARYVKGPRVVISSQTLPISKGGTSTDTVDKAKGTLKIVKNATVGQPNGPVPLDATGKIASNKFASAAKVSLDGALAVIATQTLLLEITDFDSFKNYTLSVSAGTVTRVGKTITYVSPSTAQTVNLTINGKVYNIDVQVAAPAKPSITAPIANAVVLTASYTLTSSAFSQFGDSSTHLASDWQVSTNVDFSAPLANVVADTVNKTTYTVAGLVDTNVYYARVRYKASNGNYGSWSDARAFSILIPVPATPSITAPGNNATDISLTPTFTSSAFGVMADNSTHASSDWQVATDAGFTNVVKSTSTDAANKVAWATSGLTINTAYRVRVRHRSSNGKLSAWSNAVTFTTINVFVYNTTIAATTTNYNMRSAAIAAGWNQVVPLQMGVTIAGGVVIGSTTNTNYAFDTGAGFPAGSNLTVNIASGAYVVGCGGTGGGGENGNNSAWGNMRPAAKAAAGGPALIARQPVTISNMGVIGGGGGGGGGGAASAYLNDSFWGSAGSGGGGGAGSIVGLGGAGGLTHPERTSPPEPGFAGSAGTLTTGGQGGVANVQQMNPVGYPGGTGGNLGQAGGLGGHPYGPSEATIASPAGPGGAAVNGNVNITWNATGTRLGAIS